MLPRISRRLRAAMVSVGAGAMLALSFTGGGPAVADGGRPYLALGDSVSFGFITQAGFMYGNPDNFVGYPSYVGEARDFRTVDAGCPGETTSHFISTAGADNGCGPFRSNFPLHVAYPGMSQLDFAVKYLKAHDDTKLVTVQLGANDIFLLQKSCNNVPACILGNLGPVLATITTNMHTILHALRPHFDGVLMVVNYYSSDYADALVTPVVAAFNAAETATAAADGAVVADVFTAFGAVAGGFSNHTCNTGLLNALPSNQFLCDVHPSQSGARLIANTVGAAYNAAT